MFNTPRVPEGVIARRLRMFIDQTRQFPRIFAFVSGGDDTTAYDDEELLAARWKREYVIERLGVVGRWLIRLRSGQPQPMIRRTPPRINPIHRPGEPW
jgi:hypothetical protein